MELKRFYNSESDSILRVLPLFQRTNNFTKRKEVIGVCWDTDSLSGRTTKDNLRPCLVKGDMVLLTEPRQNRGMYYKGEVLFQLNEILEDYSDFIGHNWVVQKNSSRKNHGPDNFWVDYYISPLR